LAFKDVDWHATREGFLASVGDDKMLMLYATFQPNTLPTPESYLAVGMLELREKQ
jgi:hypothetical protein